MLCPLPVCHRQLAVEPNELDQIRTSLLNEFENEIRKHLSRSHLPDK
jgi:hypothetical protein